MALIVRDLLTSRVRILLRDIDAGGIQWKDSELIAWLNDACSEISRIRPEASSATSDEATVAGSRQSIPSGGSMLLEIIGNHNSGVAGRAIRRVERQTLDNEDVMWQSTVRTSLAFRFVASLTDPRTFYLYPPSIGTATDPTCGVTLVWGKPPVTVTSLSDPIPLPDMYGPVIVNYVCFRAFQKELENAEAQSKASGFYQLFQSQMNQTDSAMETRNSKPRQPISMGYSRL